MAESDLLARRRALRAQLLADRKAWLQTPASSAAQAELHARALAVVRQLEPDCLGIYWPMAGEFNPSELAVALVGELGCKLALPWAGKAPVAMHYRLWDGAAPDSTDECGLPASSGQPVEPDVIFVPCVGFTADGYRLGYGGGYFDRYLAAHPGTTAIGLAWEGGRLGREDLQPAPHDIALMAVLTEAVTYSG